MTDIKMSDVEAIRVRHAVRNYRPDRIEEEKVSRIKEKIAQVNEEGDLHLQFIEDAGNTYNRLLNRAMGLGSAPSVIACVGKAADDLEERIGYYGEQVVLYIQKLGLNTCWAGTFNKKNIKARVDENERLVISIAVGYGMDGGRERKSKTSAQVVEAKKEMPDWLINGVDLSLLAPTAINQQKFLIKLNEDDTVSFVDKGGPYSKVDLGIVKYHFEVGAREKGHEIKVL